MNVAGLVVQVRENPVVARNGENHFISLMESRRYNFPAWAPRSCMSVTCLKGKSTVEKAKCSVCNEEITGEGMDISFQGKLYKVCSDECAAELQETHTESETESGKRDI